MKKLVSSFLVLSLVLTSMLFSFAQKVDAAETVEVEMDGELQLYAQPAIIEHDTVLVPMRDVFKSLDVSDITWDGKEKAVIATKQGTTIYLKLGDKTAKVNETNIILPIPAQLVNNHTMVPLRFVSQSLGANVAWEPETKTVKINTEQLLKIAMVTDVGGINDQSFNQLAWKGLEQAEDELGIKASYKESTQWADYETNIKNLVDEGNNLIFGIGFTMADTIFTDAQANPNQKYAIIDYAYSDTPDNLIGVVFKEEQASFLVGYIAGKMTNTGKVGFVGGMKAPIIDRFDYGYQAGVKYANQKATVLKQYANSFSDVEKGKVIANEMYQDGADIIFHAAGAVGNGVIEAAKEQDKYVIGVDVDQNYLAPDNVITSATKRIDNALYYVTKQLKEGHFQGGETVALGIAEGGVDIADTSNKHVPQEVIAEIEQLKQKIVSGEILVPYNKETYTNFEVK